MSFLTWNGVKPLPSDDPINPRHGGHYVLREVWNHLPVWACVFNFLSMAFMAMAFFTPSRTIYVLTAGFPLFWTVLYFYARFTTDPVRKTGATRSTLKIVLVCVGLLLTVAAFVRPMVGNNVATPIAQMYPGAHVQLDAAHSIVDSANHPVLDTTGRPLQQNQLMTASDGRQYKVEGKLLIDLDKKHALATYWEVSSILSTALFLIHCLYFRGGVGLIKFFVATLLYGFLLESGGVARDVFRELDYNLYLPFFAAPVATMSGWAVVFYTAVFTYEMIEKGWPWLRKVNPLLIGLVISLIALFRDLAADPVATGLALWTWNERLPGWYFGVPLINFTAWLCAVFVYGVGYTFINRRTWKQPIKITAMFAMIPLLLMASGRLNFTLCDAIEGPHGPAWQIVHNPLPPIGRDHLTPLHSSHEQ